MSTDGPSSTRSRHVAFQNDQDDQDYTANFITHPSNIHSRSPKKDDIDDDESGVMSTEHGNGVVPDHGFENPQQMESRQDGGQTDQQVVENLWGRANIMTFNSTLVVRIWNLFDTVLLPIALVSAALIRPDVLSIYYFVSFIHHAYRWKRDARDAAPGTRDLLYAFGAFICQATFNIALLIARMDRIPILTPSFWQLIGFRQPDGPGDAMEMILPELIVMITASIWMFIGTRYRFIANHLQPHRPAHFRRQKRLTQTTALFASVVLTRVAFLACFVLATILPCFLTLFYLSWCLYFAFKLSVLRTVNLPQYFRFPLRDYVFIRFLTAHLALLFLAQFPFLPLILPTKLYSTLGIAPFQGFPDGIVPADPAGHEVHIGFAQLLVTTILLAVTALFVLLRERLMKRYKITRQVLDATDFMAIGSALVHRQTWSLDANHQRHAPPRRSIRWNVDRFIQSHSATLSGLIALAFSLTFPSYITLALAVWGCILLLNPTTMNGFNQKLYIFTIQYVMFLVASHILMQYIYNIPGLFTGSRDWPQFGLVKFVNYPFWALLAQTGALLGLSTLLRVFVRCHERWDEHGGLTPPRLQSIETVPATSSPPVVAEGDLDRTEDLIDPLSARPEHDEAGTTTADRYFQTVRQWSNIVVEFFIWVGEATKRQLLEYSYLISLTVIFACSIRRVNIIHAIFLIFFMVFLMFPRVARYQWRWLVLYTELVIFVQFMFILPPLNSVEVFGFVGIESGGNGEWLWPIMGLYFVILWCSAVQYSAYELLTKMELHRPEGFPRALETAGVSEDGDTHVTSPTEAAALSPVHSLLPSQNVAIPIQRETVVAAPSNPLIKMVWLSYSFGKAWIYRNSIFFVYFTHLITTLITSPLCLPTQEPGLVDLEALAYVFFCFVYLNVRRSKSDLPRWVWAIHLAYLSFLISTSYFIQFGSLEEWFARVINVRQLGFCRVAHGPSTVAFSHILLRRVWMLLAVVFHLRSQDEKKNVDLEGLQAIQQTMTPAWFKLVWATFQRIVVLHYSKLTVAMVFMGSIEGVYGFSVPTATFVGLPFLLVALIYSYRMPKDQPRMVAGMLMIACILLFAIVSYQSTWINTKLNYYLFPFSYLGFVVYPASTAALQSTMEYISVRFLTICLLAFNAKRLEWKRAIMAHSPELPNPETDYWPIFAVSDEVSDRDSRVMAILRSTNKSFIRLSKRYGFELVVLSHLFVALLKADLYGFLYLAFVGLWLYIPSLRTDRNWKVYTVVLGTGIVWQYISSVRGIEWPWDQLPRDIRFLLSLVLPPSRFVRFAPDFVLFAVCALQSAGEWSTSELYHRERFSRTHIENNDESFSTATWRTTPLLKAKFVLFRSWIWIVLFITFISGTLEVSIIAASRLFIALYILRYGEELLLNEALRTKVWLVLEYYTYASFLLVLGYQIPAYAIPLANDEHLMLRIIGLSRVGTHEHDLPLLYGAHVSLWFLFMCILVQRRIMSSPDLQNVADAILQSYASANERAIGILDARREQLANRRLKYHDKVKAVKGKMKKVRRNLTSINDWVELFGLSPDAKMPVVSRESLEFPIRSAANLGVQSSEFEAQAQTQDIHQGHDAEIQARRLLSNESIADGYPSEQILRSLPVPHDVSLERHQSDEQLSPRMRTLEAEFVLGPPDRGEDHASVRMSAERLVTKTFIGIHYCAAWMAEKIESFVVPLCKKLKMKATMSHRSFDAMDSLPFLQKMKIFGILLWYAAWSEGVCVYGAVLINHFIRGDMYGLIAAVFVLLVAIPQYPQTTPLVWTTLILYFEVVIVVKYVITIVELAPQEVDQVQWVPQEIADSPKYRWWVYNHFFGKVASELLTLLIAVVQREMMRYNGLWTDNLRDVDSMDDRLSLTSSSSDQSQQAQNQSSGPPKIVPGTEDDFFGCALEDGKNDVSIGKSCTLDTPTQAPFFSAKGTSMEIPPPEDESNDRYITLGAGRQDTSQSTGLSASQEVISVTRRRRGSQSSNASDISISSTSSGTSSKSDVPDRSPSAQAVLAFKRLRQSLADKWGLLGRDFYAKMFLADVIVFVLTVFFWSSFSGNERDQSLDFISSILSEKSVSIPPLFLATLIANSFVIICDRMVHVAKDWRGKYALQTFNVVGFHLWLYFLGMGRSAGGSNSLRIWYFAKCIYWIYSALQLKHGYLTIRVKRGLFKKASLQRKLMFMTFRAIPFVYEIRSMIDWTLTQTSLPFFRWLKMEDIYAQAFCIKCDRVREVEIGRPFGVPQDKTFRHFMGISMIVGMVALLWFPPLILSIPGATVAIGIEEIKMTVSINHFQPFYTDSLEGQELNALTPSEFQNLPRTDPDLFNIMPSWVKEDNLIPMQPSESSTQPWLTTDQSREKLIEEIQGRSAFLQVRIIVTRADNQQPRQMERTFTRQLSPRERMQLLLALNSAEPGQSADFRIQRAVPRYIKALAAGTLENLDGTLSPMYSDIPIEDQRPFMNGLTLRFHPATQGGAFGSFGLFDENGDRVKFVIVMQSISRLPALHGYGIIGLYVVVVLSVGRLLRSMLTGIMFRIPFEDLPNVDTILTLCEDTYLSREFGDYFLEEMLYWHLITLFRSPEALIRATTMRRRQTEGGETQYTTPEAGISAATGVDRDGTGAQ